MIRVMPASEARVPLAKPPYSDEVQASFDKLMPPGMPPLALFRAVACNPRVLRRMQRGGLLDPGAISVRAREIVILRTTARCGAEYEWGVHVAFFARQAELSEAEIAATVHGSAEDWVAPGEAMLIRLVDALHARADIDDTLWQMLAEHWSDEQLVELIMLAGLYHAVAYLCNGLRVPLEAAAVRFPSG